MTFPHPDWHKWGELDQEEFLDNHPDEALRFYKSEYQRIKQRNAELEKEVVDLKVGINHLCGIETTCEDLEARNAELLAACEAVRNALPYGTSSYISPKYFQREVDILDAAIAKGEE